MKIEVFCDQTPRTSENFLALCASGYYNGTLFHRNIKGFMGAFTVYQRSTDWGVVYGLTQGRVVPARSQAAVTCFISPTQFKEGIQLERGRGAEAYTLHLVSQAVEWLTACQAAHYGYISAHVT